MSNKKPIWKDPILIALVILVTTWIAATLIVNYA